jgi:SDR family mycofactocin-dependent oxidoreductase
MGRVEGKTALVTGAARGLGRACAVRLAEEGAAVIAMDFEGGVDSVPYAVGADGELRRTVELVEAQGRAAVGADADIRDGAALSEAVDYAVGEVGAPDIVVANAGIFSIAPLAELSEEAWTDVVDTNLSGAFRTVKAVLPHLPDGASVVLTSSTVGLVGMHSGAHYAASKHGVIGLMRSLAIELGPRGIRVNCINPATVDTAMINNEAVYRYFVPDREEVGKDEFLEASREAYLLPVAWLEPIDIANAVLFLASDEARYITNVALPVDAGQLGA